MKVKIELFATLRKYGKSLEVECDGTLRGAFIAASKKLGEDFLKEIFDENGEFRKDRIILVDGRNIKDEKIEKLRENAKISVFPPIAGGHAVQKSANRTYKQVQFEVQVLHKQEFRRETYPA